MAIKDWIPRVVWRELIVIVAIVVALFYLLLPAKFEHSRRNERRRAREAEKLEEAKGIEAIPPDATP